jgi:hypothetical protein
MPSKNMDMVPRPSAGTAHINVGVGEAVSGISGSRPSLTRPISRKMSEGEGYKAPASLERLRIDLFEHLNASLFGQRPLYDQLQQRSTEKPVHKIDPSPLTAYSLSSFGKSSSETFNSTAAEKDSSEADSIETDSSEALQQRSTEKPVLKMDRSPLTAYSLSSFGRSSSETFNSTAAEKDSSEPDDSKPDDSGTDESEPDQPKSDRGNTASTTRGNESITGGMRDPARAAFYQDDPAAWRSQTNNHLRRDNSEPRVVQHTRERRSSSSTSSPKNRALKEVTVAPPPSPLGYPQARTTTTYGERRASPPPPPPGIRSAQATATYSGYTRPLLSPRGLRSIQAAYSGYAISPPPSTSTRLAQAIYSGYGTPPPPPPPSISTRPARATYVGSISSKLKGPAQEDDGQIDEEEARQAREIQQRAERAAAEKTRRLPREGREKLDKGALLYKKSRVLTWLGKRGIISPGFPSLNLSESKQASGKF